MTHVEEVTHFRTILGEQSVIIWLFHEEQIHTLKKLSVLPLCALTCV